MNNIFKNCYYINLDRSKERKDFIEKTYKNVKRIKAVDYIDIQNNSVLDNNNIIYNKCTILNKIGKIKHISYPEIAVTLSHLKAILTAKLNNLEEVIIFEDDVRCDYIDKWDKTVYDIIKIMPEDCECLQLFCSNQKVINKFKNCKNNFVKWTYNNWGATAYYINKKGIDKIYKKFNIFKYNIILDNTNIPIVADILIFDSLNTYTYTKPLFNHKPGNSTIHINNINQKLGHDKLHIDGENEIKKYFQDK